MRDRKLFGNEDNHILIRLKEVLMSNDFDIVFSHVNVDETVQIKNDEYFREHYEVLEQLSAKFIDPLCKKLIYEKPHISALNYIKNRRASYNTPYPYLVDILDDFNRKLSGLHIDRSLGNIGENIKKVTENILDDAIKQLDCFNIDDYEEPIKSITIKMKKYLKILLENSLSTFNTFSNINNISLGINQFREHELTKKLMNSKPSVTELVIELKKRWKDDNYMSGLNAFFNNLTEIKIFYAYAQLNWLGYYADDLIKVKKNKDKFNDRFNASQNDMKHASNAYIAEFLISNDARFREKTVVSYEFANVKTIVCSPEIFLTEHCYK